MPISLDDMRAKRRPAATGRLSLDGLRARRLQQQAVEQEPVTPAPEPEAGWGDAIVTGGLRVVPSILGTVGGGAAGLALGGAAAPFTAMGGGFLGGGIGEWLAQQYEKARGLRDETSYGAVSVEAGLGAIPLGKSATLARAALKGAGMNVLGGGAHRAAETGQVSTLPEAAIDATIGGAFGAGAEKIGRRFFPGPRSPAAPVEAPRNTFNELDADQIAARGAAVERVPGDETIDALDDEVYRYEDGQPRRAARDPRTIDPEGQTLLGDEGYDPQRVVSPLQHEADRVDVTAREPQEFVPRGKGGEPLSLEGLRAYRLAGDEFTPEEVIARQLDVESPPQQAPEMEFAGLDRAAAPYDPQAFTTPRIGVTDRYAGPAASPAFGDYLVRERDILREAEIDAADAQRGFDAPIPERMLPPPPEPARWEDAPARAATPAEKALRWLVPERVLKGPGVSEAAEQAGRAAADRPSPLQRLFGDQSGEVSAELAQTVGSGVAGGALGATYGDTTDEHIGGALAGTAAGVAGRSALARFMRRTPPDLPYHERPLPQSGKPIPPIRNAPTPTGKYIVEHNSHVFEFEPTSNALPARQAMPKAQADDLGLDNFPEESRDAIAEVIAEWDPKDIERQRGGRQPMAHTHALARRMKLDAETALAPGKNLSRAGHDAYANAFHATAMEARELGRKQRAEGLNDRELARFVIVQQANRALGMSYFGLRSEAGGSLNVYKHLKKLMPGEVRLLTEMIDRGRLRKDMADLGNLYADLPDDPVKAFERLREIEASQRSTMDKMTSYYTSNILSGVKTQLRNVLGNASRLAARLPAKASAGALDAFLAKAQGRERQVYASEVEHEIKGLYAGLGNAWRDGIETFKLGFSPEGLREGLEDLSSLHVPRAEWGGGIKNPLNIPGRGMAATDRFFRQLNASMELYGETYANARRAAERDGLTGAAFDSAVASSMIDQRMNPSRELKLRIAKAAERAVYQNEPGPAVRALGAFVKHVPAARFVVPFLKTVHEILKQGAIDFTLLGLGRKASRTGELRDQINARGEALAGTLALGPIAMLAATGSISGAGPTDPRKRDELYESGWRPHSIRVPGGNIANAVAEALGASRSDDGDWWVNYTLLQPIAVQAAIVANGFEAWEEHQERQAGKSTPDGNEAVITSTIMRAAQSAFDQSFLSGVGDLIDAINDPNKGQQFFGRLAQGFIPLSGLQRNVAQAVDPVVRQPEGIWEHLKANVPLASTTVDPRLDRWGEDVRRTGFGAMMVPEAQPTNRDPIADELSRLDVRVGRPSDRLTAPAEAGGGPIKMDDATALEVQRFRGRSTRAMLSMVMGAPGYENLPDFVRAEMLREAVSEASGNASDAARMSLLLQRPDIMRLLAEPIEEAAAASYPAR